MKYNDLYKNWKYSLKEGELKYDKKIYKDALPFIASAYIHYITRHERSPHRQDYMNYEDLLVDMEKIPKSSYDVLEYYAEELYKEFEEAIEWQKRLWRGREDKSYNEPMTIHNFWTEEYLGEYFANNHTDVAQRYGLDEKYIFGGRIFIPMLGDSVDVYVQPLYWFKDRFDVLQITFYTNNRSVDLIITMPENIEDIDDKHIIPYTLNILLEEENVKKFKEEVVYGLFNESLPDFQDKISDMIMLDKFVRETEDRYQINPEEDYSRFDKKIPNYYKSFESDDFNPVFDLEHPFVQKNKNLKNLLSRVNRIMLFIPTDPNSVEFDTDDVRLGFHRWGQYYSNQNSLEKTIKGLKEGLSSIYLAIEYENVEDYPATLRRIIKTWRHELQHNTQRVISILAGVDRQQAGRPVPYMDDMDPDDPSSWGDEHAARGVEFKPRVSDEIYYFIERIEKYERYYFERGVAGGFDLKILLLQTLKNNPTFKTLRKRSFNAPREERPRWKKLYQKAVKEFSSVVLDKIARKLSTLPSEEVKKIQRGFSHIPYTQWNDPFRDFEHPSSIPKVLPEIKDDD